MQRLPSRPNGPCLPQDGKRSNGGVAAQIHLPRGGEIADMERVFPCAPHESGLGVLELPGQGAHEAILREGAFPQQGHPRLVAGKTYRCKSVCDVQIHGIPLLSAACAAFGLIRAACPYLDFTIFCPTAQP